MVGSGRRDDIGGSISRSGILPFVLIIDANDFSRRLPILALIILSDLADFLPVLYSQNYVVPPQVKVITFNLSAFLSGLMGIMRLNRWLFEDKGKQCLRLRAF